jgi:mycothiol synthase
MTNRAGVEVELVEPERVDDVLAEVVDLQRLVEAETEPDDPPVPLAEVFGELTRPWPGHRYWTWVARADGRVVGRLSVSIDDRPANRGFIEIERLDVHPASRRQGVATALVEASLPVLDGAGGTSVMAWPGTDAGLGFSARIGLAPRQEERRSRLLTADIDEAQQREWIEAPGARVAGYEVVSFVGPVPDAHVAAWAAAADAMSDAPLDDLEWNHEPVTLEWVRSVEAMHEARGVLRFGSLALSPEGDAAGMTLILIRPDRARLAHQEDTAVVPAHRGHGLGRWLKAANLATVRAAMPEVEIVQTFNAESNGPMLDINVAMGFRPNRTFMASQAPLSDIVRRLT